MPSRTVAVAYKWALDPASVPLSTDGTPDLRAARSAISEDDPVAIALGRQLADSLGCECIGLSVGGHDLTTPTARKIALSHGLDRLTLVADAPDLDAASTAQMLASLVRAEPSVDLVLTSEAAIDTASGLVPATLAGYLGWPCLFGVTAVTPNGDVLRVTRRTATGAEELEISGPAVLAVASDAVPAKVPGMRDILMAGKKLANVVPAPSVTPTTIVPPQRRRLPEPNRVRAMVTFDDLAALVKELA